MRITVVRALPGSQALVELDLEPGATAAMALAASGLGGPEAQLGVGGRRVGPGRRLEDGERVEILRPLAADPNEIRRRRARRLMGRG
ncbi:MAG: RnfH family protein [Betaproteobacteria bacterium]|nr:RnfH family protein [Betaproteobacteria bacterium]